MSYTVKSSENKMRWSAKQKRLYHRLLSLLTYWEGHDYQLLRIDLTSSTESDSTKIREHHRELRRKVEQVFGFDGIETFIVETSEGPGSVLHIVWAWKPKPGMKQKRFEVPYWWLSMAWICLHRAYYVYIQKYDVNSARTKKRVSRYFVTHYLAGHDDQLVRYSYSWKRTLGFPLVRFWKQFQDYWLNHAKVNRLELYENWGYFMQGYRLADVVNGEGLLPSVDDMKGVEVYH